MSIRPLLVGLLLVSGAACGGADAEAEKENYPREAAISVWSVRAGTTGTEFNAMPDSARLEGAGADMGSYESDRGVAVEVNVTLNGYANDSIPLAYTLHDARNKVAFVSKTMPLVPDADRWHRRAYVWLPVPSPGSYYVQVTLNDSTGSKKDGPVSRPFTIQ